jgi:chromosome segregation ATPase
MNQQVKQLQSDTGSLQDRMNSLEGLSGRVSAVEKANADLESQIEANAKDIQTLTTQTKQLEGEITTLQERSQATDKFFEGLKTLVDTVLPKTAP